MALAESLNQANDPFGFSKIAAQKDVAKRGAAAREMQPEVLRQQAEAERGVMEAERQAKQRQAQEGTRVEDQFARGMESAQQTLQQQMAQRPQRNFSEFNPDAGIELAALTAILGSFAGAASGRAALKSMKGITEGYRLGQQDLYERSAKDYEYQLQEYKDKINRAKENYTQAMKLEEARRGAGLAKLKEFSPELAGTVMEAHLKNNNVNRYKTALDEASKIADQLTIKAEEARLRPVRSTMRLTTVMGETEDGRKVPLRVDVGAEGFVPGTADRPLRVGDPGVLGIEPEKAAQAGVRERSFALRTFTALRGVVEDFKNLLQSPATSAMPALAGVIASDPQTVTGSLIALAARDMTSEDERAFQQLSEQIAASLARIEAQGLASGTTQANVRSFDALRPKAGDKAINMALYLARLKQEIEIGLEVFETNTGANEKQMEIVKRLANEVDGLIPYTVDDVLKIIPGGSRTLSQATQKLLNQSPVFETIVDAQPEAAQPAGQSPREGDESTSRSGRPIVFRNGGWEYK